MMKKELKKRITLLITALLIVSQICMNTNVVFAEGENEAVTVSDDGDCTAVDDSCEKTGDNKDVDGDNPEGDNPEGDNPEGDNPEGDNPEGGNPDGDNPEGNNPEGDNPEGDNPEGDNTDGDNPEGDNPEGDNPDGDNPEGDNPEGDNPEGGNPDGDNPDGDLVENIDEESSVSENSTAPKKVKEKVQEKAVNNPVIEEVPFSDLYSYEYETIDTLDGVTFIKGVIPEDIYPATKVDTVTRNKKVGQTGKLGNPCFVYGYCYNCGKELTERIWANYYLVPPDGGYSFSNPDIIKDCQLMLFPTPNTSQPVYVLQFTAAKPGVTTVNITYYFIGSYRMTGMYCDNCDKRWTSVPLKWFKVEKEAIITVTGDYALIYDANGGENAPDSQRELDTTESSWTFTVSDKEPTREGYIFKGWSTSPEGTSNLYHASDEITLNETGEVTVYAVWEPDIKYTVTYTDGVDGEDVFVDQVYTCKPNVDTPEFDGTPYREGYDFIGWRPEVAKTVTGDATYVAQWKKKPVATTYTVRWYDSNSNEIKTAQTRSANVDDVVHVTDADKVVEGYIFDSNNAKNVLEATALKGGTTTLKLYFYVDKPHKPNKPKPDKPDKPSETEKPVTIEKVEQITTVVTTTQTVVDKEVQPREGNVPKTGEEDFTILYACIAALAGCGLVILRLKRGKRSKDNDNNNE